MQKGDKVIWNGQGHTRPEPLQGQFIAHIPKGESLEAYLPGDAWDEHGNLREVRVKSALVNARSERILIMVEARRGVFDYHAPQANKVRKAP